MNGFFGVGTSAIKIADGVSAETYLCAIFVVAVETDTSNDTHEIGTASWLVCFVRYRKARGVVTVQSQTKILFFARACTITGFILIRAGLRV